MKKHMRVGFAFAALLFVVLFSGCGANYNGKSKVTVYLNLQKNHVSMETPLIDRFLRIFATDANAQTAPTNLTSLTLKISGADMESIINTYTSTIPSSIDVEVPSGKTRVFDLSAQSNTYYYTGTASQDLEANIDATVPIAMAVQYSTVTLTPDFGVAGTPSNITGYTLSASVTNSGVTTTLLASQAYALGTAIQIPTGTNRDIIITALAPTGNYSGSATNQNITAGAMPLTVIMANQYTNVAITTTFPAGTPAANMSGTFTVNVKTGSSTVYTQSFTPGTALQIPSGDNKNFEIIADTASVYFSGTATGQTLVGNSTMTLPVTLSLYKTKIVIPEYVNQRITQIDDITGANPIIATSTSFSITPFTPFAIDYDAQGRIYVVNYINGTGVGLFRIDNINATTPTSISNTLNIVALAIDKTNNMLYYTTNSGLTQYSITNATSTPLTTTCYNNISGLAVDDSGMLYITCSISASPDYRILKYNTSPSFSFNSSSSTTISNVITGNPLYSVVLLDIMYKSPYIYIANAGSPDKQIMQFDTNLTLLTSYGISTSSITPAIGEFWGAEKFVAIRPNELIIIDENSNTRDRLLSIDDITGANWTPFGSNGPAPGQFNFYSSC